MTQTITTERHDRRRRSIDVLWLVEAISLAGRHLRQLPARMAKTYALMVEDWDLVVSARRPPS